MALTAHIGDEHLKLLDGRIAFQKVATKADDVDVPERIPARIVEPVNRRRAVFIVAFAESVIERQATAEAMVRGRGSEVGADGLVELDASLPSALPRVRNHPADASAWRPDECLVSAALPPASLGSILFRVLPAPVVLIRAALLFMGVFPGPRAGLRGLLVFGAISIVLPHVIGVLLLSLFLAHDSEYRGKSQAWEGSILLSTGGPY